MGSTIECVDAGVVGGTRSRGARECYAIYAGTVARVKLAAEVTGRFCESTGMSVANRARVAASLAKHGKEGNHVLKLVSERAEDPAAAHLLANLRLAKSKVGGAAAVAGKSLEDLAADIALDNDRAGLGPAKGLDTKIKKTP